MHTQKEKQMSEYMTVAGIVQFDPRTRQAGGKEVRDVLIRALNSTKNFSITVWPENTVEINKGDFIIADGKYNQTTGQNKEGEQVTYHNLSATNVLRFTGDSGSSASAKPKIAAVPDNTGDEFPF
jgi:hypothetical protein